MEGLAILEFGLLEVMILVVFDDDAYEGGCGEAGAPGLAVARPAFGGVLASFADEDRTHEL